MKILNKYKCENNNICYIDFSKMRILLFNNIINVEKNEDLFIQEFHNIFKFNRKYIDDFSATLDSENIKDDLQYWHSRSINYMKKMPEYIIECENAYENTIEKYKCENFNSIIFYSNINIKLPEISSKNNIEFFNLGLEKAIDPDFIFENSKKRINEINSEKFNYAYKYQINFNTEKKLENILKEFNELIKCITVLMGVKFTHSKPILLNFEIKLVIYYLDYFNDFINNWKDTIDNRMWFKDLKNFWFLYENQDLEFKEAFNFILNSILVRIPTNNLLSNYWFILEKNLKTEKKFNELCELNFIINGIFLKQNNLPSYKNTISRFLYWLISIKIWRNNFIHKSLINLEISNKDINDYYCKFKKNKDNKKKYKNQDYDEIKLEDFKENFTEIEIFLRSLLFVSCYKIIFGDEILNNSNLTYIRLSNRF